MTKTHANREWLSGRNFNLLVDYYTEVQERPYGSGVTRDGALDLLNRLKPGYICIYAKGHSGFTTFGSSLRTQHNMLAQDMPELFRDVTTEAGVKLILYYSGLLDGLAGVAHPDWVMRKHDGTPFQFMPEMPNFVSYAMCPQSPYLHEWVNVHLQEMFYRYDPDGIWVDGDWPGPCYCPKCEGYFRKKTGYAGPMPQEDARSEAGANWMRAWQEITLEWRTRFANLVKALKKDCLYSAGNVSPRREFLKPRDWLSGDFFSPPYHRRLISQMMRWYGTLDTPYDAFVCDTVFFHSRHKQRSRSKALSRILQESVTVLSNGGALGYWTYPMPDGAFVPSRIKKAQLVADYVNQRQEVFINNKSAQWTVIVASEQTTTAFGGSPGLQGAARAMLELHRSPDVMDESGLAEKMPYELVVLPEQPLDGATVAKLETYVASGGKILSSGSTIQCQEFRKLLGVDFAEDNKFGDGHVLLKKHYEPTGVLAPWDKLKCIEAVELYPLYLSSDHFEPVKLLDNWPMHGLLNEEKPDPAGVPAAVVRKFGRGSIVHLATDIFSVYHKLGDPQLLRWIKEIVDTIVPDPFFRTDAASCVEISLRLKSDSLLVHFVNGHTGRDLCQIGSDDLWVDEVPAVGPINVWLKCDPKTVQAQWQPGGNVAEMSMKDGHVQIVLPKLEIHSCLEIKGFHRNG